MQATVEGEVGSGDDMHGVQTCDQDHDHNTLCAGQQGHRYPDAAGLPRPPLDQFDHALCCPGAGAV